MLLIYLTAAWILGIFLARLLWAQGLLGCASPPVWGWGALSALLIAVAILLRRRKNVRLSLVLTLFALLGAWRYQSHPIQPCFTANDLTLYNPCCTTLAPPSWI